MLDTYSSFEDKSEHFNITRIETIDDFTELLNAHKNQLGIYRGVSSSTYKMFTSLQRTIQYNQDNFIDELIKLFKSNLILKNYFNSLKIKLSYLSIYSFLQHYGVPTPFLDFTKSFKIALFFAINKFDLSSHIDKGLIDDYFSIFFIESNDLELLDISNVLEGLGKLKKQMSFLYSSYMTHFDDRVDNFVDFFLKQSTQNVFLINDNENCKDIYNIYNNIRIVSQQGIFLHNGYSNDPLEIALKKFFKSASMPDSSAFDLDHLSEETIQDNRRILIRNQEFQKRLEGNIIQSFEIKKSLIPRINHLIPSYEMIYPDSEKLCLEIFKNSETLSQKGRI